MPPLPVRLLLGGLITAAILAVALQVSGVGAPPSVPSSPIDGVIVSIDASSLTEVRGFTLRTAGGDALDFNLGALENPTQFPPGHLAEHQATSSPVRVYFRVENGERVVYRLEDAVPSPAPS